MRKIKRGEIYIPKGRIQNAMLYDDVIVIHSFLWWVISVDLGIYFKTRRVFTKKEFRMHYKYDHYIPTHQEVG